MNTEYDSSLIKHQLRPRTVRQYRALYQKDICVTILFVLKHNTYGN